MVFYKKNKWKIVYSSTLLLIITLNILFQYSWLQNQLFYSENKGNTFSENNGLKTSETDYDTAEWLQYGNFSAGSGSFWNDITSGDTSDFNLAISGGAATYKVMGEQRSFSLSESPIVGSNWLAVQNPDIPYLPDSVYSDSEGLKVYHQFTDNGDANQIPSAHWDRNFTMPVDMSDYVITSASFDAVVNATVSEDVDVYSDYLNGYYSTDGGAPLNQIQSFDYVRFYVLLSDLSKNKKYELGYYQPSDLGAGNPPGTDYLTDTYLTTVSEEVLIFYLTSVLSSDNYNFTVTIGIRIYCADSSTTYDTDTFTELLIKTIDLSFTYEKKINQLNSGSWRQDAETIPSNYIIENATLNFKYKIDKDWTTYTGSLNSEFRIIINTNQLGQTVKLTTATTSYQDFVVGGLDVSSFISPDQDVNVSIQVYIGDQFNLDTEITVSIDNVSLIIGYGIYTEPDTTTYDLILNDIDRTTEKSTEVIYGKNLNVTFVYKNSTGDFIPGADVQLSGGGLPTTPLSQDLVNEQYYKIINTTNLGVGTSYLTLTASKRYHTSQEFQITVTVTSRNTELQLFLNGVNETINKEIEIQWNENLNITIKYLDIESLPSTHIDGANVELTGAGATKILSEDPANQQYEIPINTNILGVGSTFLTVYASLENYTSLNIRFKVTVNPRTTSIDNVELNGTLTTSIQVDWNELFPISMFYNDSGTGTFISGATVQLIGPSYLKELTESGNEYTESIDSSDFTIGNNFLTILAQKDNYSIASQLITITVIERDTNLDIYLDEILRTAIELPYAEPLNITAIYEDTTGYFLDGATVELRSGGAFLATLSPHPTYNQYNLTINTDQLSIGVNPLVIYAKKDNYTAYLESITITIGERNTNLDVYLEEVLQTAITLSYAEPLNITAIYKDGTGYFLDGATVELRSGGAYLDTLLPHPTFDQYNLTIYTDQLNLGVNSFVIYAKKDNYTAALASITITVDERNTTLDVYLEEVLQTAITLSYAEPLNITAIYKDGTGYFLDGATVELQSGGTYLDTLLPHPTYDQYYLTIYTDQLNLGVNLLSIYAKKDNYTAVLASIVITVSERSTVLDIFLDEIQTTSIAIAYGELLNITAIYKDGTGYFLDGAMVELRSGGTYLDTLLPHPTYDQYNLTINTDQLSLGANLLSIYAQKDNYTAKLVSITITVNERSTSLEVLLDDIDSTTFEFYNISVNEYLNITAIYNDFTDVFIDTALVQLTGSGIGTKALDPHPTFNQYNYTLKAEDLGIGVHFLVISAEKENYSTSILNIKLNILERAAYLLLFINETELTTNYFETEIDQILNITVQFRDIEDDSHISLADISLTGALDENFTEVLLYEQYNVSILSNNLGQGINFLTIFAQKAGYKSESILFTVEVKEKASNLELFLNDDNKTLDKSIQVTIGEFVNITVIFEDYTGLFIDNATVTIVGEGISMNLTKHPTYNQYNLTLDSDDLNFGINFLTLYAQKVNYQPKTFIIKIEIIDKDTDLHVYMEYDGIFFNKTIDRTLSIPIRKLLNITVNYFDIENGTAVEDATVQLVGTYISLNLSENPLNHQYSISVNTSQLGLGVKFLTIYCSRPNYQSYSALFKFEVNTIIMNISTMTGETVFNLAPREDFRLRINLRDTAFNISVLNATLRYTWAFGQGFLTDENNDGIYEALLTDLPVGTFIISITVNAGDDYEFSTFQVTMNIIRPPENVLLFQVLTIVGIAAAIGVSGYLLAYQKVLKYPKQVRKIHKFKSKLKKKKPLSIEVSSREGIIQKHYSEEISALEKQIKKKLPAKSDITEISNESLEKIDKNGLNSP